MTTIYNAHHDGDQYRVTKFVDGDPESSYLCTPAECACPAGSRPTCRHRQMLPEMIDRGLVNSHLFLNWDHPARPTCDFDGNTATLPFIDEASPVRDEIWLSFNPVVPEGQHVEEDTKPALDGELITVPTADGWNAKDITPAKPFRRI